MINRIYLFCSIFVLILLSACGFKPIYRNYPDSDLNSIKLEVIESVAGAEIYQYLLDTMPCTNEAKYSLKIHINESSSPSILRHNSDVIRQNLIKKISYNLTQNNSNIIICSGSFNYKASYNNFLGPYASFIEEEKFNMDISKTIALEIRKRLIICLKDQ